MATFKSRLTKLVSQKQIRENRLITKKEIADATGLSRMTIDRWFAGDLSNLQIDAVFALCQYFECELSDLVDIGEMVAADLTPA